MGRGLARASAPASRAAAQSTRACSTHEESVGRAKAPAPNLAVGDAAARRARRDKMRRAHFAPSLTRRRQSFGRPTDRRGTQFRTADRTFGWLHSFAKYGLESPPQKRVPGETMVATVIAGEHQRDGAAIDERVLRGVSALTRLGVGEGDVLAIMLRNEPAFLESMLIARFSGCYSCPINWHYKADEAGYILRDSGADRKSTRLNSSHSLTSRMPSSA